MKKISEHTIIGIAACAAVYLSVFIYLQVSYFGGFGKKTQFNTYSQIENDEIRLTADNIDAGDFMGGDISNISRDRNDSRVGSSEDWAENEYEGWFIVEAEQDPAKANPLEYAKIGNKELVECLNMHGYEIEGYK